jgi:transposase
MARGYEQNKRFVGIDLAKRTMEVCILEEGRIVRHGFKTDAEGRRRLIKLLGKSDTVAMELCCCALKLTREIEKAVGCKVYDLNAGELKIIWQSRKKTDREDALKIAKYVRDTPEAELAITDPPSEEVEAFRSEISMKEFLKKERNQAVNRLHSLYGREGIIDVTKKDLADKEGRESRRCELSPLFQMQAAMLEAQLEIFEKQLAEMEEKVNEKTRENELAPYIMSIPGVGIGIASVLLAYLGDGRRFTRAAQVANYAGLTPNVDCSGMSERYGSIAKHTCCRPIRAVVLEGVWSLLRSKEGGPLKMKLMSLRERMGKKKSAVAVARKMVCLAWLLMKRKEVCYGVSESALERKLRFYKVRVRPEKWGSAA